MATNSRMMSPEAAVDPGSRLIPSCVWRVPGSKPVRGECAGSLSKSAR